MKHAHLKLHDRDSRQSLRRKKMNSNKISLESIEKDIERIRSWDISEEDKENILGGTLERLIKSI